MSTIQQLLERASNDLQESATSRLDAEILLSFVLKKPRSTLYAWPEREISSVQEQSFLQILQRRKIGEPIAYILGIKEFWGRDFFVDHNVLIPRPDTELLIELILEKFSAEKKYRIIDLGTGSGAIAVTLKKERPAWEVFASDVDEHVLRVAKKNSHKHSVNVNFICANWCDALQKSSFDVIVSNPPYIDKNDSALELMVKKYEPEKALIADEKGLADVYHLISEGCKVLTPGGFLFLEHGAAQANKIATKFTDEDYCEITKRKDLAGKERATFAKLNLSRNNNLKTQGF